MSKYNLTELAEGMGYKEYEDAKEADRLEAHPESAKIKAIQAMMAKEKSLKEDDMSQEDEMKMHLKQYNAGNIDGDDLAKAFDEILNGRISPPGERGFNTRYGMEEGVISDKSNKDLIKMGTADMNLWHVQKLLDAGILQDSEKTKALLVLDPTNPWGMEESFKTDGESEDSVDNIDKVASPSAKGVGYDASIGAERSEDDKEQSDITQTTKPMYTEDVKEVNTIAKLAKKLGMSVEDLEAKVAEFKKSDTSSAEASAKKSMAENGHVEDYKDEIKEGAYKNFVMYAKERYSNTDVQNYIDSLNNDMRLNGDEDYNDWTVEDYMEDLDNYVQEKSDDAAGMDEMQNLKEHFSRFK